MKDTVYTTVEAKRINTSTALYFADVLGYEPNDMVKLTFYKKGRPSEKKTAIKRVVRLGDGRGCYLNRSYGIDKGDVVVLRIEDARGVESGDTGIETEKTDEESSE